MVCVFFFINTKTRMCVYILLKIYVYIYTDQPDNTLALAPPI